jgi:hypothetical protein
MKHFASPSFYRTFDLLLGAANPGLKLTQWSHDGVDWARDRYSISGRNHGFVIEVISLTRPGRNGWSMMVTKEHWWAGEATEAVKSGRWARPMSGRRKDIMEWFRKHERELDRALPATQRSIVPARALAHPS